MDSNIILTYLYLISHLEEVFFCRKFLFKVKDLVPLIQIGKKCGAKLSTVVYQDLQLFVSFGGSISGLLRILDFKWLLDKIVMMGSYLNFR